MKTITWIDFRELVSPRLKTTNCDTKREIHNQLVKLEKKSNYKWFDFVIAAKEFTFIERAPTAEFRGNLGQGRGSKELASAIYFWLHSNKGLEKYAKSVDKALLDGKLFSEYFPDLNIHFVRDFQDFEKPKSLVNIDTSVMVAPEMEILRDLFENVDLTKSRDLALVVLLNRIEDIMNSSALLFKGNPDLHQFRNSFAQVTDWVDPERIRRISTNSFEWETSYRDEKKFCTLQKGHNFVLIRPDGARLVSSTLHGVNAWLTSIWELHRDKVIEPKDIQVFMRYILIFAACGRSKFLKMYFRDDVAKIDIVIRMAIEQAAITGIDLTDYNPIDDEYLHYYNATVSSI